MKMFFSVFFGSFFAIMAAASALYFISEYQNAEGAKQLLRDTTTAAKRLNSFYGTQSANLAETARETEIELRNEVTLTKTVNIKTADGTFTIPSGTTVRTVHEKAEPGSIHINYEGYTFSIPLNVVAAGSQ